MLRSWRTISFRSAFPGLSVSPLMHRPSQMFLCFHDTERFNGCVTKGSPTFTARFPVISNFTSKWSLQKGNTSSIGGRGGRGDDSLLKSGFWTPQVSYFWSQDGCKGRQLLLDLLWVCVNACDDCEHPGSNTLALEDHFFHPKTGSISLW